jgi:hypothetical protein
MPMPSRREFLVRSSLSLVALALLPSRAWARASSGHPVPRPGITGDRVLTKKQLARTPGLVPLFDSIRAMPEIVDGIRCNCDCSSQRGFYSLLSCYEGDGMARDCRICQGQGRLAARLHKAGKSLAQIRRAVDAEFG